jgi:hypothetical protein
MNVGLMTELEAVNYLLLSVGEQPVNSLTDTRSSNVHIAKSMLTQTSRQAQSMGLHCNSEDNYKITLTSDNEIIVPNNAIRVDPSDKTINAVHRSGKLYNKEDHTFKFEEALEVDVVWFLEFKDLPQVVRDYITIKAGRLYQSKVVGSSKLYQFSLRDEMEAFNRLMIEEIDTGDYNILDNQEVRYLNRRW